MRVHWFATIFLAYVLYMGFFVTGWTDDTPHQPRVCQGISSIRDPDVRDVVTDACVSAIENDR